MRRIIFVAFLFCFIQAFAKTPPIPEALLNAKTAYVGNHGAALKDYERLCNLLKEWGRFELVPDTQKADIIITISSQMQNRIYQGTNIGISGNVNTIQVVVNYLTILDARNLAQLWSDETSGDSNDPRQFISNLKNRMKKK